MQNTQNGRMNSYMEDENRNIQTMPEEKEEAFDLVELIYVLLGKIHWIILVAVIFASAIGVYDYMFAPIQYQATSKLYVLNNRESAISLSDLQIGAQLTSDYMEVFKNWQVHEIVKNRIGMSGAGRITVTNPSNTRMLYITARASNAADAKLLADTYAQVAREFISEKMDAQEPNIFSEAQLPTSPSAPRKQRDITMGFALGALLSAAIIIIWHIFDDRLRTSNDISEKMGLPVMGLIPSLDEVSKKNKIRKAKKKPVAEYNEEGVREATISGVPVLEYHGEEAFNTIATNLTFSGMQNNKVIITSFQASEGKSFVSMQLADRLSRHGKKVVLVDADLRRSMLLQRVSFTAIGKVQGLAHYLSGQAGLSDVLYHTDLDDVYVIPIGQTVSNPMVLLNSPLFSEMLDKLSESFDYVIVDAPPVGLVIDAAEMAKYCDGIVFVSKYNHTGRRDLSTAVRQMQKCGKPILGVILNGISFKGFTAKHYYNKGYYSHYYKSGYYKSKD